MARVSDVPQPEGGVVSRRREHVGSRREGDGFTSENAAVVPTEVCETERGPSGSGPTVPPWSELDAIGRSRTSGVAGFRRDAGTINTEPISATLVSRRR